MANIPSAFSKVQLEESSFRSSISTDLITRVGGTINQGIDSASPVPIGSVEMSMLNEAQFQSVRNTGWVLADGRDITGSALHLLTGQTTAINARARFLRGKDNGRGLDPNGDLPIGSLIADEFLQHNHFPYNLTSADATSSGSFPPANYLVAKQGSVRAGVFPTNASSAISITLGATGAAESRPNNVTVNYFIRIN